MEYDHISHGINLNINLNCNIFIHGYVRFFFLYFENFGTTCNFIKPNFRWSLRATTDLIPSEDQFFLTEVLLLRCVADVHIYSCCSGLWEADTWNFPRFWGWWHRKSPRFHRVQCSLSKGCPRDCSNGRCCRRVGGLQAEIKKKFTPRIRQRTCAACRSPEEMEPCASLPE